MDFLTTPITGEKIMNNNQMTATALWNEITEVQSENLNGGSGHGGYNPINVNIGGGVGSVQINGGDGSQVNLLPTGEAARYNYRPYRWH
jgi:hypothetical protein